jgi:AcrR family transcriptional regulator
VSSNRKARGDGHERRAEILAAAQRIFVSEGYAGATIRKIAEEVGVSPTAIYMHFPDKHSMLMELGLSALEEMIRGAQEIAAGPGDPEEKIRQIMRAHIRFALKNKTAYQLVFTEGARDIAKDKGATHDQAVAYYRVLPSLVSTLQEQGRIRAGSAHGVAQVLWMGCHGMVTYLINNPGFGYVEVDELTDLMVDGLVAGLVKGKA